MCVAPVQTLKKETSDESCGSTGGASRESQRAKKGKPTLGRKAEKVISNREWENSVGPN